MEKSSPQITWFLVSVIYHNEKINKQEAIVYNIATYIFKSH